MTKFEQWDAGVCTKCGGRHLQTKMKEEQRMKKCAYFFKRTFYCPDCFTRFLDSRTQTASNEAQDQDTGRDDPRGGEAPPAARPSRS